ncbi:MAG: N-acetylornithine carbamoyltransferase [Nevskiaceae bacterium]|jgi:N-acetylornithine carbamoyltransferase|nr:N-acetylornithine carbamoyltransferase [Nevskiaceae bacterium]
MKRFIDLADFEPAAVRDLIALAQKLEREPEPQALAGKVLGLLFMNPSLRTLASFQAGMARLGGSSFVITPGQGTWNLESRQGVMMDGDRAEHVREGIPVLASYSDALGIRSFAEGKDLNADLAETGFRAMAELVDKPLINMESAMNHPCQALADWKTMDELGVPDHGKFVLSWVYHPRALPLAVPAAAMTMAAQRGMEVVVLRPEGYEVPAPLADKTRALAKTSGGSFTETSDRASALKGARVLYAKEWGSTRHYGDARAEAELRKPLSEWRVEEPWFQSADPRCHFMHCLPVRRNVAVADALLDGPRSVVVREAYNRMPAQMAVLHRMLAR